MIKTRRVNQIQDYINKRETVSMRELVAKFNVSKNTIRRDVQELVDGGEFDKVYGGVSVNHSTTVPFSDRQIRSNYQKEGIAKIAAGYVEDGDIIFIDSGTTTLKMLEYIGNKRVTVITNNIDFIMRAIPYENLTIISTGGMLEPKTKSFTGVNNKEVIRTYNINKAFLASTGISIKNGVTNSLPIESEIKAVVVEQSEDIFLLVDHSKFDKYSLTTYCDLAKVDYLVTDELPHEDYIRYAKKHDIKIVIP